MAKEIVILGAGESGVGAALLATSKGLPVFVSDSGIIAPAYREELAQVNIEFEEGGHSTSRILNAGEVIKSPGIPDNLPVVKSLRDNGIDVISDIEFASRYTSAHIIGITGSNGKTTTTMWIHHILKEAGLDAVLSGNIGISPCRELVKRDPAIFVMEISSFQLDCMQRTRINTAVITNITPDHLDRYDYNFENYINSKFRITRNQAGDDSFIWCADDPVLQRHVSQITTPAMLLPFSTSNGKGAAFINEKNELVFNMNEGVASLPLEMVALEGKHNIYNAMAAALAATRAGASKDAIITGLSNFNGVEHRLEKAGEIDGVLYINDSKATNVKSTWYALESMNRPVIWIAGGTDKGNDYTELSGLAREKVKALVCLGIDNKKLISSFTGIVPLVEDTNSMNAALEIARLLARPGDVVLLSPACASFDLFKNYEHRGRLFKEIIAEIK